MLTENGMRDTLLLLMIGVPIQTSIAATNSSQALNDNPSFPFQYVIMLSLGPDWTSGGETQTFFLQSDIEKTYTAKKETQALADGELFIGLQRQLNTRLLAQLGLAIAATGNAKLEGDIWEDADPDFNNYTYTYKINHKHITVKGKLLVDIDAMGMMFQPYISGSVGMALNHAYGFTITPKLYEEVPAPAFTSNTETAFTYTLGIGLQKAINSNWQISIGYEFANWGESQLGPAPGQTLNKGLHLSHLYTNAMLLSLSYVT